MDQNRDDRTPPTNKGVGRQQQLEVQPYRKTDYKPIIHTTHFVLTRILIYIIIYLYVCFPTYLFTSMGVCPHIYYAVWVFSTHLFTCMGVSPHIYLQYGCSPHIYLTVWAFLHIFINMYAFFHTFIYLYGCFSTYLFTCMDVSPHIY